MTLLQPELLAHLADAFPDAIAWKNLADDSDLSLGSWHTQSNQLARGMHSKGLLPGDRVALAITEDYPFEWLISYMAIHKAGAVAVPLNTRLNRTEVAAILRHAGVKALLASDAMLAPDPTVDSDIGFIAAIGRSDRSWSDLLDPDGSDIDHRLSADDEADIMYTSGTTGAPKGVIVRHSGLSSLDRVPSSWHGLGFITSSPFSTTSGSLLICGPMRGGLSGWFLPKFDPARWLQSVETKRPVAAFLVPAMVQLIVADTYFEAADLSSLFVVNIGSAPIAVETLRKFGRRVPAADVMCGYGMTEFGAVTATPVGDSGTHAGSVGRPLPGVTVQIIDPEGNELQAGEIGQITVHGERHQRSYFQDPEGSTLTWNEGWLLSGDLGFVDPDGFLWVVGRQKELIIRGGHNIVPGEVEAALFEYPDIVEAAVTGVPHPVLGEDVAAWLVTKAARPPSVESVRSFLLERLADYKVPRRITFVDALPRNEAGKVLKAQLMMDDEDRSTE